MGKSIRKLIVLVVTLGVLAALAGTLLGFAGETWWAFDLLSHFRLQFVAAFALALVLAILLKRWKLALAALVGVGVNIAVIAPLYVPNPTTPGTGPTLKLLHLNAWSISNQDPEALARYLQTADFDLVLVQESNVKLIDSVVQHANNYKLIRSSDTYRRGETVAFVNQSHAADFAVRSMEHIYSWRINELRLSWQGKELALLSPHMTVPAPGNDHERQLECEAICDWANARDMPTIVIGDLNATPWCKAFRSLLANTELINSQQGFGVQCSWPCRPPFALSWMFVIPIDHCLHSADFVTTDRRIGPWLGSDHLPLEVELQLRAEGARSPSGRG